MTSDRYEETFAIINNGDLVGSTKDESVREAWNEVEDLTYENGKWKELEQQGYKLIRLLWKLDEEYVVRTEDYL